MRIFCVVYVNVILQRTIGHCGLVGPRVVKNNCMVILIMLYIPGIMYCLLDIAELSRRKVNPKKSMAILIVIYAKRILQHARSDMADKPGFAIS